MKLQTVDKNFSMYIRLRDSKNGYVKCCSCGKLVPIKESDAGHFVNRKHMSLRFNEINVNAQCRACNRFDEGNLPGYAQFLIDKYGKDIIKILLVEKQRVKKYTQFELKEMNKLYRKKIKELQ